MKFKDRYFKIKNEHEKFIVIMKNGIFYNVLGKDCYIIKNIFNYKINEFGNTIRIGFPINSLNKVLDGLDKFKISYLVYESEINLITYYNSEIYKEFLRNNLSINDRIKIIYERLNLLKYDEEIFEILKKVEDIL